MEQVKDRQTLNRELLRQDFDKESRYVQELARHKETARNYARLENAIVVLSDLRANLSYVYYGGFADTLGLKAGGAEGCIDTIWEEDVFRRIHPGDLEEKYLQELRFLHFVRRKPRAQRAAFGLVSKLRMRDASGAYRPVLHRMFYIPSPSGSSLWLSLCLYSPLVGDIPCKGLALNLVTGQYVELGRKDSNTLLSDREKEILRLIDQGLMSKHIAEALSISIHTVSRHRQEILSKLRVKNSLEACRVARGLGLI